MYTKPDLQNSGLAIQKLLGKVRLITELVVFSKQNEGLNLL